MRCAEWRKRICDSCKIRSISFTCRTNQTRQCVETSPNTVNAPFKYIPRPIPNEIGRYYVPSSRAGQHHIADIVDDECSCIGWTTRERKHRAATGKPYRCCHLKAAHLYAHTHLIETMRQGRDNPTKQQ